MGKASTGTGNLLTRLLSGFLELRQQISVALAAAALLLLCVLNVAMASEGQAIREGSDLKMIPMVTSESVVADPVIRQADMLSTEIETVITGFIVRTKVRQHFRNPSKDWMEGIYQFPLPDDAAVDGMTMIIGERRIVSEIQEKKQAKKTYQKAAAAGKKAALLSQQRPNMFTTSVANIEPGGDIIIELSFQSLAAQDGVNFTWRMPQAITPRYNSPMAPTYVKDGEVTQQPDQYTPDGGHNKTSFRIAMMQPEQLASLESPSHDIDLSGTEGDSRLISLASGEVPADRDFVLNWQFSQGTTASTIVFIEHLEGADYVLGMVLPPQPGEVIKSGPRDITFIVDVSGSMHGISMDQAQKALLTGLSLLSPEDRFDIIAFNDQTWRLFNESRPATVKNIRQAQQFVASLRADRGTEMFPALKSAFQDIMDESFLRQIMFLTDGAVSNEARMFDLVERSLGPARLFTVGLGNAPNSWFMRKAAEQGRGVHIQVTNLENTQKELEALFQDMSSPSLQNIHLQMDDAADTYPRQLPDLFGQRPLLFVARQESAPGTVEIAALSADGKSWAQNIDLATATVGEGISKFWARKKIESLGDARSRGMDPELVRTAVIDVSLSHNVLSEFTSFVAVDTTPARIKEDFLKKVKLQGNLPQGTTWEKFFGPKTATPMVWQAVSGTVLLMLAIALFIAMRRRVGK